MTAEEILKKLEYNPCFPARILRDRTKYLKTPANTC